MEFQIIYLEKLLESDFVINDNWPSEAPDITLDFKNWLVKKISGLKIKLIQNQKSELPEILEDSTLAELGLEEIIAETLESRIEEIQKGIAQRLFYLSFFWLAAH